MSRGARPRPAGSRPAERSGLAPPRRREEGPGGRTQAAGPGAERARGPPARGRRRRRRRRWTAPALREWNAPLCAPPTPAPLVRPAGEEAWEGEPGSQRGGAPEQPGAPAAERPLGEARVLLLSRPRAPHTPTHLPLHRVARPGRLDRPAPRPARTVPWVTRILEVLGGYQVFPSLELLLLPLSTASSVLLLGSWCQKLTQAQSRPGHSCHPGSGHRRLSCRQLGLADGEAGSGRLPGGAARREGGLQPCGRIHRCLQQGGAEGKGRAVTLAPIWAAESPKLLKGTRSYFP